MLPVFKNIISRKKTEDISLHDPEFEAVGRELKAAVDVRMRRSLAIRELDSGSDNATEIEINLLSSPHYDVERFGISFVASPRHADLLLVTGAVTRNMEVAVKKTYEAMPAPKYVIAVGDDACDGGIYRGTYAVLGGVDAVLPVDLKIPGNPPEPIDILRGILALMTR